MSTANPSRPTGRSFRLVCPPEQMPQVESLLRAQGYEFEPEPFSPFCRRLLCEPRPLGSSLAAFFGYIYIQDRSSMLPPLALAPRQGEAVLDMCASPGSKTGFLGQLTGPDGFVLGNELSRARLATLRANLHACNLPHVGTCSFEGQAPAPDARHLGRHPAGSPLLRLGHGGKEPPGPQALAGRQAQGPGGPATAAAGPCRAPAAPRRPRGLLHLHHQR